MGAFLYGAALQWKLDIRSRAMLITCYVVPLLFFLLMGGIFTTVMPQMRETLIPSMIVMGVSMGALIGLPPSLAETYGSEIKKAYQANGVPLFAVLLTMCLSAFVHLMLLGIVILVLAPVLFDAALPKEPFRFLLALALFILVSLGMGSILGLTVQNEAKLTMLAQMIFLPSIMLSGIMFPMELLPKAFQGLGRIFPSSWGYRLMQEGGVCLGNLWYLLLVLVISGSVCAFLLKRRKPGQP